MRLLIVLSAFCAIHLMAAPKPKLLGTETDLKSMEKLHRWCEDVMPMPDGFYHWRCCSHDGDVNVLDYKDEHRVCRNGVDGHNAESITRSCAHRCGAGGPTPAIARAAYAFTDSSYENVSYVVYCQCPNIVAGEKYYPPKIKKLP